VLFVKNLQYGHSPQVKSPVALKPIPLAHRSQWPVLFAQKWQFTSEIIQQNPLQLRMSLQSEFSVQKSPGNKALQTRGQWPYSIHKWWHISRGGVLTT
tara:strand:+ start:2899 stop:3192 length:294 start_codon:yes stop_codon:yes gene_type:complete